MAGKKQNGLSPMMEQYFDIKSKYPDMLLFFRLGDFYEMFFDDAKIASEELVKLGYTNIKEFGGIIDWPYEIVE